MEVITARWHGPYTWYGAQAESIFQVSASQLLGVYVWTAPVNGQHLGFYVGETGRSFAIRHRVHAKEYHTGEYRIYDPESFARGQLLLVRDGRFFSKRRWHIPEKAPRSPDLDRLAYQFLDKMRIFVMPMEGSTRIRKRVEGAIAMRLGAQPLFAGAFNDLKVRWAVRHSNEDPLLLRWSLPEPVEGLGDELEA